MYHCYHCLPVPGMMSGLCPASVGPPHKLQLYLLEFLLRAQVDGDPAPHLLHREEDLERLLKLNVEVSQPHDSHALSCKSYLV